MKTQLCMIALIIGTLALFPACGDDDDHRDVREELEGWMYSVTGEFGITYPSATLQEQAGGCTAFLYGVTPPVFSEDGTPAREVTGPDMVSHLQSIISDTNAPRPRVKGYVGATRIEDAHLDRVSLRSGGILIKPSLSLHIPLRSDNREDVLHAQGLRCGRNGAPASVVIADGSSGGALWPADGPVDRGVSAQ